MLVELQPGDSVTVWKLDRLGRSLIEVVTIIDQLGKQGIGFKSLTEQIDTTSAGGRLMMHMVAAFAEFERSLIIERTKAGQARAVREGRKLGRRRSLTPAQEREIRRQVDAGEATKADLARLFNVHASTITRLMERSA
jgi:DNA invertase Pin-like site-specific DNA recombinase